MFCQYKRIEDLICSLPVDGLYIYASSVAYPNESFRRRVLGKYSAVPSSMSLLSIQHIPLNVDAFCSGR